MKLARIGDKGRERPVIVDDKGQFRALSSRMRDLTGAMLAPRELVWITSIDPETLPIVEGTHRYGVPIAGIGKVIGIEINDHDHAQEPEERRPEEPALFVKAPSTVGGPNDPIRMPRGSTAMDSKVELGVVIGTEARYVAKEHALEHVAGYVLVNDLSERDHQLRRGGSWDKGKNHDGFAPVGPWLVTRDEIERVDNLDLFLGVSGERRQTGSTRSMTFHVATLVSYVSEFMTLHPGDIITTGMPGGIGVRMAPPHCLRVGDEIHLGVSQLGEQRQRIVECL